MSHKILIVLYYYHPYISGLSILAKMQAEGLIDRGHEVTVLTTRYDNRLHEEECINGVNVVRSPVLLNISKGGISWDFIKKIVRLSKDHDIINPHLPMAHFGLAVPFLKNKRIITQYHCDLNLGPRLLPRVVEKLSYVLMDKTLRRSDKIVVTTRDYFSHCYFAKYLNKTIEIYPPIDQTRFMEQNCDELRGKLGIEEGCHLIGFVGRIVEEKGIEYLLNSIPFLEKELDDFRILLAGDYDNVAGGSIKPRLDKIAKLYPNRVKFLGQLTNSELVSFYNLIDVLVLPSVDPLEAFGMVQLEALFCRTPVVVSDLPGVREVVKTTGMGKLAEKKNSRDIAEKVIELKKHPVNMAAELLTEYYYSCCIDKYEDAFTSSSGTMPI